MLLTTGSFKDQKYLLISFDPDPYVKFWLGSEYAASPRKAGNNVNWGWTVNFGGDYAFSVSPYRNT